VVVPGTGGHMVQGVSKMQGSQGARGVPKK